MNLTRFVALALGLGLALGTPAFAGDMPFQPVEPVPGTTLPQVDPHQEAPGHQGKVAVLKRNGKIVYVPLNAARNMERSGAGTIQGAVDPNLGYPGQDPYLGQVPPTGEDAEGPHAGKRGRGKKGGEVGRLPGQEPTFGTLPSGDLESPQQGRHGKKDRPRKGQGAKKARG